MKITVGQFIDIFFILETITPQPELTVSAAYALRKLKKAAEEQRNIFDDVRLTLLEKYTEKDENDKLVVENGQYKLGENREKFAKDIIELLQQEQEVEFKTLSVQDLGNVKISIEALDKLIECGIINE